MRQIPDGTTLFTFAGEAEQLWHHLGQMASRRKSRDHDLEDLVEWVVFRVADESYGIEVVSVQEVVRVRSFTSVPHVPREILGIFSLRGEIVQAMDMRIRMRKMAQKFGKSARIMVVRSRSGIVSGLVVDEVCEVLRLSRTKLLSSVSGSSSLVKAVYQSEAKLISLLDINRVLETLPHG